MNNFAIALVVLVLSFDELLVKAGRPLDERLYQKLSRSINNDAKGVASDRARFYGNGRQAINYLLDNYGQYKDAPTQYSGVGDLTQLPFNCPTLPPSNPAPTSVHALRPSDIGVVAALGDSISAGTGVRASNLVETFLMPNRGESWSVGGERSLEEGVLTLTNILRKYNPQVQGASYCSVPDSKSDRYHGFNIAIPGDKSRGMESQASELVTRLSKNLTLFYDTWKVVTLLIGANDLCQHCLNNSQPELSTPEGYRDGIKNALDVLYNHLPKTFVNAVAMADVSVVQDLIDPDREPICRAMHRIECPCALQVDRLTMKELQLAYYEQLNQLVESSAYTGREDFTVVMQPFLKEQLPFKLDNGTYDMSYFAPDCFHPSAVCHQAFAFVLWNTMVTPYGSKPDHYDPTVEGQPAYMCPTEAKPYIFTKQNSGATSS